MGIDGEFPPMPLEDPKMERDIVAAEVEGSKRIRAVRAKWDARESALASMRHYIENCINALNIAYQDARDIKYDTTDLDAHEGEYEIRVRFADRLFGRDATTLSILYHDNGITGKMIQSPRDGDNDILEITVQPEDQQQLFDWLEANLPRFAPADTLYEYARSVCRQNRADRQTTPGQTPTP